METPSKVPKRSEFAKNRELVQKAKDEALSELDKKREAMRDQSEKKSVELALALKDTIQILGEEGR